MFTLQVVRIRGSPDTIKPITQIKKMYVQVHTGMIPSPYHSYLTYLLCEIATWSAVQNAEYRGIKRHLFPRASRQAYSWQTDPESQMFTQPQCVVV
jgi:hypothetical protein